MRRQLLFDVVLYVNVVVCDIKVYDQFSSAHVKSILSIFFRLE